MKNRLVRSILPLLIGGFVLPSLASAQGIGVRVTDYGVDARVTSSASYSLSGPVPPQVPVGTLIGGVEVVDELMGANDSIRVNGGPVATNGVAGMVVIANHGQDQVRVAWIANGILNDITISYTQVGSIEVWL